MKKTISLILTMSMIFSLSGNAFAYNGKLIDSQDTILLKYDGHGQYTKINSTTNHIVNNILSPDRGDVIQAKATEDKEIYQVTDDKYLIQNYDTTYTMADKLDVNINDINANNSSFEKHNVPLEIIEEIKDTVAKEKTNNNKDFAVSIFAPSIVTSPNEAVARDDGQVTTSTTYYYHTNSYGTYHMKDYMTKYWNCSSGMITTNDNRARETAAAFVDLFLSCSNSQVCALFGIGKSALDVYQAIFGTVVYGRQGDYISTNIVYDRINKVTSVETAPDVWQIGLYSFKVWLNRADVYQFYGYTGQSNLQQPSINCVGYSDNYNNPDKAVIGSAYDDRRPMIKVCNTNVVL